MLLRNCRKAREPRQSRYVLQKRDYPLQSFTPGVRPMVILLSSNTVFQPRFYSRMSLCPSDVLQNLVYRNEQQVSSPLHSEAKTDHARYVRIEVNFSETQNKKLICRACYGTIEAICYAATRRLHSLTSQ
jgi:hypothetical protein